MSRSLSFSSINQLTDSKFILIFTLVLLSLWAISTSAFACKLGDLVWLDTNANGIQDEGEPGIGGVMLKLFDKSGNYLEYTTTDENGYYLFRLAYSGCYIVSIDASSLSGVLADLSPSPPLQGQDPEVDSNGHPEWFNASICLASHEDSYSLDFGFYPSQQPPEKGALGDWVWLDENGDGIQDDGEVGIGGVLIRLLNQVGQVIQMTTTEENGYYHFEDLDEGCYIVAIDATSLFEDGPLYGLIPSPRFQGDDVNLDSNGYTNGWYNSGQVCIAEGEINNSIDFGFYQPPEPPDEICFYPVEFWQENLDNYAELLDDMPRWTAYFGGTITLEEAHEILNPADFTTKTETEQKFLVIWLNWELNGGDQIINFIVEGCTETPVALGQIISMIGSHLFGGKCWVGLYHTHYHTIDYEQALILEDCLLPTLLCEDCSECDGKVTELTLKYNGEESVEVKVIQKKNCEKIFEGTVEAGGTFTFNGMDKQGTMSTEIKIYVNGEYHTKIHTSCSQPIGPGLVSGDFEVINGYSRNGGLLCPITPEDDQDGNLCDDGVKPQVLTMVYTGEGCDASNNLQDPAKTSCEGDPLGADPVFILATNKSNPYDVKAKVWFVGPVSLNTEFDIDATNAGESRLKAETYVHIFGESQVLLQTVKFHTSCSQPLHIGDQFGSLVLVGFIPEGETETENVSAVEDPNSAPANIKGFALFQNHPNPFNPETVIGFQLAKPGFVELSIYNTLGQEIRTLVQGEYQAGYHSVRWDGIDNFGNRVAGGIYLYQIKAGDFIEIRKMSFVR